MLCQNECVLSKGQIRFTNLTDNKSSWQTTCNLIYSVSIDTYTRYFQYKILHNFLSVNSKFKKMGYYQLRSMFLLY